MNKVLITIVIPFYDNDVFHMTDMLTFLERLTFNKEIIFIDDRNNKSEDIRQKYNVPEKYKIIWSSEDGKNVGTFESRRTGVKNATGDYLWFVDIDDEPLSFDPKINEYDMKDLYCYNNKVFILETQEYEHNRFTSIYDEYDCMLRTMKRLDSNKNKMLTLNVDTENEMYFFIKFVDMYIPTIFYIMSNKIFKKEFVMNAYKSVEFTPHFILGEDTFINKMCFNKPRYVSIQINPHEVCEIYKKKTLKQYDLSAWHKTGFTPEMKQKYQLTREMDNKYIRYDRKLKYLYSPYLESFYR